MNLKITYLVRSSSSDLHQDNLRVLFMIPPASSHLPICNAFRRCAGKMLLFWTFKRWSCNQTPMFCSLLGNGKQFHSTHLQPTHFSAGHNYIFCSSLLEHGNKKTTVKQEKKKKKERDWMQKETNLVYLYPNPLYKKWFPVLELLCWGLTALDCLFFGSMQWMPKCWNNKVGKCFEV